MRSSARMQNTGYRKPGTRYSQIANRKSRIEHREWVIQPPDHRSAQLAKSLRVSPLLAQVLINRGVTDAHAGAVFLRPKLTELIQPEQMPGVETAVSRVKQAIRDREKITVYGDYDVDGITGVSILWQILTLLGADTDYYIPHRVDEGYGLNEEPSRHWRNPAANS